MGLDIAGVRSQFPGQLFNAAEETGTVLAEILRFQLPKKPVAGFLQNPDELQQTVAFFPVVAGLV